MAIDTTLVDHANFQIFILYIIANWLYICSLNSTKLASEFLQCIATYARTVQVKQFSQLSKYVATYVRTYVHYSVYTEEKLLHTYHSY